MAPKKDNLPLTLDQDQDSTGTITYANEVVAVIAGVAANEVEGVAGMCAASGISVMMSALMHNASTILVVANSLRLMFFPPMEGR